MCFERQHYILEIMYLAVRKVKTVIVNVVLKLKKNAGWVVKSCPKQWQKENKIIS